MKDVDGAGFHNAAQNFFTYFEKCFLKTISKN